MENNRKKMFYLVLALVACIIFTGCSKNVDDTSTNDSKIEQANKSNENNKNKEYSQIKFSEMYEIVDSVKDVSEKYKALNGKPVELSGYMAVQSPLDESYIYLVNQPYVSCPFCAIGDITKLEIIPIYMADGSSIKYSENGVTIRGTLEIAEKIDALEYTTQFRIYADSVTEIMDTDVDTELQTYYANLSDAGMIIDIQTLQMNIEYGTKEEYLVDFGTTKAERYAGVSEYYSEGLTDYVVYIKECPGIVQMCEPEREDLKQLNKELYDLYEKQIKVLEDFAVIILKGQEGEKTDVEKEALYDELLKLNDDNLALYEEFNSWNNKLRE